MFVPGEPLFQAYLLCVLMGMAAGSVAGNLVFPLSQQSYVIFAILPIIANLLYQGSSEYYLLGTMVSVFLLFVIKVGHDQSKFFELSIRRGFENVELIRQLEQEQAQTEAASAMKSKLLAAVSHDLRQPLFSLNLFLDALKPHIKSSGDVLQAQITRATQVLHNMFENLFDISKLDSGVVRIDYRQFDIQVLLDAMREEFEWLASQKQLRLEVQDCSQLVCTDVELLLSILRNLVSNAIRYTEQGEIRIECNRIANGLQLAVSDTGIGIAPEHLPHIFDEYYQVGNTLPRSDKGLGLGLAIVKRLEQLLGYQMQVSSSPGKGTQFSIVIPIAGSISPA
jgi:signal transduction histidine kinase